MATTTPNFGWAVPTSTDLVKDGAVAIETLGDSIDASLVDLKGGTTGQVLAKASNTDMDFSWVAQDDSNAIQNSIVDAKGDLIAATANDTPARLAVGNNGETLVADSSTSTGLRYQGNYAAGKNIFLNADCRISQRGTTFTNAADGAYTLDRFQFFKDGTASVNVTQETFTPGTAPVAGYEASNYIRLTPSSYTSGNIGIRQNIEDVRTFAGQTVTISFWAKASTSTSNTILWLQNFGSGGSAGVNAAAGTITITTSWARYSVTVAIPSVSGKTIGTSSYLMIQLLRYAANSTVDIWGTQIEAGSVATAFQTATGTIQGELAACQRYLPAISGASNSVLGYAYSTTGTQIYIKFPTTARVAATGVTVNGTLAANYALVNQGFTSGTPTAIAFNSAGTDYGVLNITTTAGAPTLVAGQPAQFQTLTSNGYILFTGCEL